MDVQRGRPPQTRDDPPRWSEAKFLLPRETYAMFLQWCRENDTTVSAQLRKLVLRRLREVGKLD